MPTEVLGVRRWGEDTLAAQLLAAAGINVHTEWPRSRWSGRSGLGELLEDLRNDRAALLWGPDGQLIRVVIKARIRIRARIGGSFCELYDCRDLSPKSDQLCLFPVVRKMKVRGEDRETVEEAVYQILQSDLGLPQKWHEAHLIMEGATESRWELIYSSRSCPGLPTAYLSHTVQARVRDPGHRLCKDIGLPQGVEFTTTMPFKSAVHHDAAASRSWAWVKETVDEDVEGPPPYCRPPLSTPDPVVGGGKNVLSPGGEQRFGERLSTGEESPTIREGSFVSGSGSSRLAGAGGTKQTVRAALFLSDKQRDNVSRHQARLLEKNNLSAHGAAGAAEANHLQRAGDEGSAGGARPAERREAEPPSSDALNRELLSASADGPNRGGQPTSMAPLRVAPQKRGAGDGRSSDAGVGSSSTSSRPRLTHASSMGDTLKLAGKQALHMLDRSATESLPVGRLGVLRGDAAPIQQALVQAQLSRPSNGAPRLVPKLTIFHGTSVPILIAYYLSPTEGHYLGQTGKFWSRVLCHGVVWKGFYCRDFYKAADGSAVSNAPVEVAAAAANSHQRQVKCVWVQLEGRSGVQKCLYHMRNKAPREFEEACCRITKIPGRSRAELMDRYKEWMRSTHRVEANAGFDNNGSAAMETISGGYAPGMSGRSGETSRGGGGGGGGTSMGVSVEAGGKGLEQTQATARSLNTFDGLIQHRQHSSSLTRRGLEKWSAESMVLGTKPHLKPRRSLGPALEDPIGPRVRNYDQRVWGPHNRYLKA